MMTSAGSTRSDEISFARPSAVFPAGLASAIAARVPYIAEGVVVDEG